MRWRPVHFMPCPFVRDRITLAIISDRGEVSARPNLAILQSFAPASMRLAVHVLAILEAAAPFDEPPPGVGPLVSYGRITGSAEMTFPMMARSFWRDVR